MQQPNVDSLLQFIGYDKIRIDGCRLVKKHPSVQIDLNSIAQGATADYVARWLDSLGWKDYLVEVGGEIFARGHNAKGGLWRVGIDKPIEGNVIPGAQLQVRIGISNRGLATSGNYRKFYTDSLGRKIVHTFDARTGAPVISNLLSATVVARTAAQARRLRHALYGDGPERKHPFPRKPSRPGGLPRLVGRPGQLPHLHDSGHGVAGASIKIPVRRMRIHLPTAARRDAPGHHANRKAIMQPVCFLYNPTAGETVITEWLDTIISIYQRRGCTIVPYRLGFRAGEPELIADLLGHGYRHVLVAGGDGTVNYVVGIMKHHGIDLPVAVLPTGTANDFAGMLGVPGDISRACRAILDGEEQRVDLGVAGGERFVNVFSCGLFTDVSQKTPTVLKNNFGKLAYYFGGLGELPNFRKMHITIRSEEVDYDGTSLIFFVFNGRTAGKMRFAYSAEIDDGLLDVIVVKGDGPIGTLRALFHFIRQNAGLRRLDPGDYPEGVLHFKSRDFVVDSPMRRNEVTDIDGQPGPRFPVRITCEAGALRVIRPAHHRKD